MRNLFPALILSGLAAMACTAQAPSGPTKSDGATARPTASRPAGPVQLFKHVQVDLKNRTIALDAKVATRTGPLEFLLCKEGTKDYESILSTEAQPSHIHAALLLLGLTPGRPAEWIPISDEEARFLPPRGGEMEITLEWKDKEGKPHKMPAGQWLSNSGEGKRAAPKDWVFVGSEVLPDGSYLADSGGEIISVANFSSSVIDVPFESTDKNDLLEFVANQDVIPPRGTRALVTLHVPAKAAKAPYARETLDIDRWGRLAINGRRIAPKDLRDWAGGYIARHERGMVVIRAAAEALVYDVERARMEMRLGGVREFDVVRLAPDGPVPPRTPEQAKAQLADWQTQFASPEDYIVDPGQSAEEELKRIAQRKAELEAMRNLLNEYELHLRQDVAAYRASTQPVGKADER